MPKIAKNLRNHLEVELSYGHVRLAPVVGLSVCHAVDVDVVAYAEVQGLCALQRLQRAWPATNEASFSEANLSEVSFSRARPLPCGIAIRRQECPMEIEL